MSEYDKIDIPEGVDINTTNASRECDICHYWYFLSKNCNYEPYFCNSWHNLMQKAMNFKGNDYRIHFRYMSKMMQ